MTRDVPVAGCLLKNTLSESLHRVKDYQTVANTDAQEAPQRTCTGGHLKVIKQHGIQFSCYADDSYIYP